MSKISDKEAAAPQTGNSSSKSTSKPVRPRAGSADKPAKHILYFLLVNIQLSIVPLYLSLPPVVILLILSLCVWQLFIVYKDRSNPGQLSRLLIVVLIFVSLFYMYGHLLGQQPGVALIILMTVMKLFEMKALRDCYVIVYSCFFIIASTFFQSQSVWLIFYVMFVVITLTMTLIMLSDRRHTVSLRDGMQMAARYVVLAIPMMLILFILFPRIPGPLWALPKDAFSAQTGLSEEMSPGSINKLISSSAIAFRVKFEDEVPQHAQRYWRGAVLSDYDGRTWRRRDAPEKAQANIRYAEDGEQRYSYTITLEPTSMNWLLSLEYAHSYEPVYRLNREAMLLSKNKVNGVISYRVESASDAVNEALFSQEDYKNRLLPVELNPKTIELTKQLLSASAYDTETFVRSVLSYFRNGDFVYTLNPDLLGSNVIDEFLFDSKKGFCEHYASAFTYLMRAAGIPARVVIGYQGGKMNPLDDYMIVRQSDAHAWTEVWFDGRWNRIDPTAVVSPGRIEQGVQDAGLEINRLPLLLVSESSLIKNMAFIYDSFQNSWNQWVIGFDQKKQYELLKSLGMENTTLSNIILLLVTCLTIAGLVVAWLVLKQRHVETDRVQNYYNIFCRKLQGHGIVRELHEGPLDFEKRLMRQPFSKGAKDEIKSIIRIYRALHYGNHDNSRLIKPYIKKVKAFKLTGKNRQIPVVR